MKKLITENIKSVKNHGSAITVAPVIETVMLADDDKVYKSVERSKCNMAKAPQSFFLESISMWLMKKHGQKEYMIKLIRQQ